MIPPPPRTTLFPYTTLFRSLLQMAKPRGALPRHRSTPELPLASTTLTSHRFPLVHPERVRSEEHTSELQSQSNLVCRLLLEKKKKKSTTSSVLTPHKYSYEF